MNGYDDQLKLAMWLYANRNNPEVLAQLAPQRQPLQTMALGTPPSMPSQQMQQMQQGLGNYVQ